MKCQINFQTPWVYDIHTYTHVCTCVRVCVYVYIDGNHQYTADNSYNSPYHSASYQWHSLLQDLFAPSLSIYTSTPIDVYTRAVTLFLDHTLRILIKHLCSQHSTKIYVALVYRFIHYFPKHDLQECCERKSNIKGCKFSTAYTTRS